MKTVALFLLLVVQIASGQLPPTTVTQEPDSTTNPWPTTTYYYDDSYTTFTWPASSSDPFFSTFAPLPHHPGVIRGDICTMSTIYQSDATYVITSPNFPYGASPNNLDCRVDAVATDKCISLHSLVVDLERNYDFLHVGFQNISVATYDGQAHIDHETETSGTGHLHYETDISVLSRGFAVVVTFKDCYEPPIECECGSCPPIEKNGVITSSGFPGGDYRDNENCTVHLTEVPFQCPHFYFETLDLENRYDYVSVYVDGVMVNRTDVRGAGGLLFSGRPGSHMAFRFESDGSVQGDGFKAYAFHNYCHEEDFQPPPLQPDFDCAHLRPYYDTARTLVGHMNTLLDNYAELMAQHGAL